MRRLPEMQVLPTGDQHPLALLVGTFPLGIGRPIGLGVLPLKEGAMLIYGATIAFLH